MSIRTIHLPDDLPKIADVISDGYQYPENPNWNIQADQSEQVVNLAKTVQKLWPLIWFAQQLSPIVRDGLRGYVWEIEEKIVGICIYRRLNVDIWRVLDVVVLPAFRRQGIAQKLMQAAIADIQEKGGKTIILDVIAENVPPLILYEKLGFQQYASRVWLSYRESESPQPVSMPDGYMVLPQVNSLAQYEFERRITPTDVQRFSPITQYNNMDLVKTIMYLLQKLNGIKSGRIAIFSMAGDILAVGNYLVHLRTKGVNTIQLCVDPNQQHVAAFGIRILLNKTLNASPGRRIEFAIPDWQKLVIDAALDAGCVKLFEEKQMGKIL